MLRKTSQRKVKKILITRILTIVRRKNRPSMSQKIKLQLAGDQESVSDNLDEAE